MKNYKTIQEVRDCDELSEVQKVQIEYYEDISDLKEALENYEKVDVYVGSAREYAEELFDNCYEIPSEISGYIDYEQFTNDLLITDIYQFSYKYLIINIGSI